MQSPQADEDLLLSIFAPVNQRQLPAFGINPQHVFELVDAANGPPGERDDFVVSPQTAAVCFGLLENAGDHDRSVVARGNGRPQRGMIDDQPAAQRIHEVLDLVDRDGISRPRIDPPPFLE